MTGREWTGSVAVLPDSMDALAVEMANKAHDGRLFAGEGSMADRAEDLGALAAELAAWLADHAYTLSEWAAAVRELYARLDEGEPITNAQAIALARVLGAYTGPDKIGQALITLRPFDLPAGYIGFELMRPGEPRAQRDHLFGGIAPDGRVST